MAPRSHTIAYTIVKAVLAIAVSVGALWWAFSGVDLEYVRDNLARTSLPVVALYLGLQVLIHVSRIARYWLLVAPLGPTSVRAVAAATSVGLPAAVFLPLRLGELVRPMMMSRAGIPIAGALASVVVERVVDGLVNVALFFTLLKFLPESAQIPSELRTLALIPLAGFGGAMVFFALAYVARARVLGLVEKVLARISPKFAQKIVALVSTFLDGLVAIGTAPRLLAFLALTAFYWGTNGYATFLLAQSYGLDVPVLAGPFAISCVVFAVTVPAGPAFAGTLEAGFRVGLAPFGVSVSNAALVAIVAHVLQLCFLALIAFIGLQIAAPSQRASKDRS